MTVRYLRKALFLFPLLIICCSAEGQPPQGKAKLKAPRIDASLKYNKDGKFKILQLTDTHVIAGDPRSDRALKNINAVLDAEKPDFVIHTGDIIYGSPAEESLKTALQPLVDRGIPFAVALGNHDSDFDKTREEVYEIIRSIPGNVNCPRDVTINGCSNDILTLSSDGAPDRVIYLFDSGNREYPNGIKSWGYVHWDQVFWYRNASNYFKAGNGGNPIPSLAFFHIPVPEYRQALIDSSKKARFLCGNLGEEPASPLYNPGLFLAFLEQGDVRGIVTGHDHNNDYVMLWRGFFLIYGRYGGCDTVYNDLKPSGARVFEFTAGESGFRSWIRLSDGRVEQELSLVPGMKTFSDLPAVQ